VAVDTVSILEGDTFVVSDRRGDVVPSPSEPQGLFMQDTRFLSCWRLTVDGGTPEMFSTDEVTYFSAQFFLMPPPETCYDQAAFSIMRKRSVGGGFHEDLIVLNHTAEPLELDLRLEAAADFADLFEVKDTLSKRGRALSIGNRRPSCARLPARALRARDMGQHDRSGGRGERGWDPLQDPDRPAG